MMRGSQLIGLNIRGSDDHQLGTVKDFIVDYQAECPMIYFAVEPDASLQLGEEYVILPYSAMQYRYDNQGRRDYFALDVSGRQLRNAPHVAVNDWSTFNDRQVLGNAHQFYQRTERTAARPIEGGPAKRNEQETRPETGTRPDAGSHPDNTSRPEAAPRLNSNTEPKTTPQPEGAARPAAARPESGDRPATGARPDSSTKEPAEHAAVPGGWLTSKPTWWGTLGCSTTSVFCFAMARAAAMPSWRQWAPAVAMCERV
jgi:sporulation protein YlmC with PRC-barrel domain